MKNKIQILTLAFFSITSALGFSNEELTKKLDNLFDLRIKTNEQYRDEFTSDAEELENKKAREFLTKSEKEYGQVWIDFLKRMKKSPDLQARLQILRIEIQGELQNAYYDLEYAFDITERVAANANIARWETQMTKLKEAEALYKKSQEKTKTEAPAKPE